MMVLAVGCYRTHALDPSDGDAGGPPSTEEDPDKAVYVFPSDTDTYEPTVGMGTDTEVSTDPVWRDCCLDARIAWGQDCMMDHVDPVFVIDSCGEYAESDNPNYCVVELPDCPSDDLIDSNDFDELFVQPDFVEARTGGNGISHFGASTFPIFYISLTFVESEVVEEFTVGDPCGEEESCVPIPPSIAALKTLLDTIVVNPDIYNLDSNGGCHYH
jgi:hypothetical protein